MTSDSAPTSPSYEYRPVYISYIFLIGMLVLVGWLKLATPLITVLFAYFVLRKLHFVRSKILTIVLFVAVVAFTFYGFVHFIRNAIEGLPEIADKSIPRVLEYAQQFGVDLPFDDRASLKALVRDSLRTKTKELANFAKIASTEFVFLAIGLLVAASLFYNPAMDLDRGRHRLRNNLYSVTCDEIVQRFQSFYRSFETVMGAQIVIAAINTTLTGAFVFWIHLPHWPVIVGVTFICGLLPVIGNIISNSVITAIAFTIEPQLAIWSLAFLIGLHKLEYLLNSKIIGDRIKNPVWLTLLGLILGERLMGIPGMILAPVMLNFIKNESTQIEVRAELRKLESEANEPAELV
jgi:predicted PurR-regulated permease PerM